MGIGLQYYSRMISIVQRTLRSGAKTCGRSNCRGNREHSAPMASRELEAPGFEMSKLQRELEAPATF